MQFYTLIEVQKRLGGWPTVKTLRRLCAEGRIPHSRSSPKGPIALNDSQIQKLIDELECNSNE
jgi:hypothetical protein